MATTTSTSAAATAATAATESHGSGSHQPLAESIRRALRCPGCGSELEDGPPLRCVSCGTAYPRNDDGPLDLRLHGTRSYQLDYEIGSGHPDETGVNLGSLPMNANPEVDFSTVPLPHHLTGELRSFFPRARDSDNVCIDIGCGRGICRDVVEHSGFAYLGIDYGNPGAATWADAHALPLADNSIQFAISNAVFEHIRFPHVAMAEVYRVLAPGGVFLGSVAFQEPYHSHSYYHFSHLGTLSCLQSSGFRVEHVSPSTPPAEHSDLTRRSCTPECLARSPVRLCTCGNGPMTCTAGWQPRSAWSVPNNATSTSSGPPASSNG
jgi:SAM-dependent methyltransferase